MSCLLFLPSFHTAELQTPTSQLTCHRTCTAQSTHEMSTKIKNSSQSEECSVSIMHMHITEDESGTLNLSN